MGTCYYILALIVPFVLGDLGAFPEDSYSSLNIRDLEDFPGPLAWGHKYIGGGAGEGDQYLSPEGVYHNRQQVKTDAILPAYCEPPNPCPVGYSAHDGCTEEFENTADFSRDYQSRQQCICDEEHMFNCPQKDTNQGLGQILHDAELNLHKTLVAKKFSAEKRAMPRKKRSTGKDFDWKQGEPLVHHRAKKG